jgi:hypothetical protein
MKKSTAGLTFAAVVGLSALSATPAMAVTLPFPNCGAAAEVGVYNIPAGTPGYGVHLDRDRDGFGCDAAGTPAYNASIVAGLVAQPAVPAVPAAPAAPAVPAVPAAGTKQIVRVPVGGADTGVTTKSADNTAALALGAGLVLAAATAGTFVVRRRTA